MEKTLKKFYTLHGCKKERNFKSLSWSSLDVWTVDYLFQFVEYENNIMLLVFFTLKFLSYKSFCFNSVLLNYVFKYFTIIKNWNKLG